MAKANKKRGSSLFGMAILGLLLAVAFLKPVAFWNGLVGFPAWAIFSVAYILEWDENDSPLIQLRNKFIDIYAQYAILEPAPRIAEIDYATANMTVEDIIDQYSNNYYDPVVIRGLFKSVPAVNKWTNPDYFATCCGDDEYLTLIDGRVMNQWKNDSGSRLAEVFKQEIINLREIVNGIKNGKKYYINNLSDLFRKHNDVLDDLQLPTTIGPWWGENHALYRPVMAQLFMGQGSKIKSETTGSAWHCARHANLFIQVVGDKTWEFMDPKYSLLTFPHLRHHVVAAAADALAFRYLDKWPTQTLTLHPGDMLYNPPWRWHTITNQEGFNIGVATRELMHNQNLKNNFMFTILQEFSPAKSSFFVYKRPVARFLSKIPFFFMTVSCIKEALFGYTGAPTDAWTNSCDEHSPVCVKGVTDLQKSAALNGK